MLPAKTEQPILDAIFDTGLVIAHKRRALRHRLDGATFLLDHVLSDLGERLSTVDRRFERAAVLFGVVPDTAEALRACGQVAQVIRIEADAAFGGDVLAPPETVELEPGSIDLAVSMLALHETNDVPGLLAQIRRALRPDGLFLAALPGACTLVELRESLLAAELELAGGAAARVSPFVDVRDAGALLQRAGFALPVADIEPLTVRYDHMFALMRDLRAMGATSALAGRSRRPATRQLFARAAEIYAERFADPDGRIRASFPIVWMSGWAPDASQQKPARRGSANARLADFLK